MQESQSGPVHGGPCVQHGRPTPAAWLTHGSCADPGRDGHRRARAAPAHPRQRTSGEGPKRAPKRARRGREEGRPGFHLGMHLVHACARREMGAGEGPERVSIIPCVHARRAVDSVLGRTGGGGPGRSTDRWGTGPGPPCDCSHGHAAAAVAASRRWCRHAWGMARPRQVSRAGSAMLRPRFEV
jgi:hypothetical protein